MIVGCYTLDLYCHNGPNGTKSVDHPWRPGGGCHEYTGNSKREAMRSARKSGWVFRGGECYCPSCKGPLPSSSAVRGEERANG